MLKDCKMQLTMKSNYLVKGLGSFQLLFSVFVLTSMCPLEREFEEAMRLVSTFLKHNMNGRMFLTHHKVGK
jgi:hypothetical protein